MRADRNEHGVKVALATLRVKVHDHVVVREAHTQRGDPLELATEHLARHPVGGDAIAHHPARLRARIADLDLMAAPRQVVGSRKPTRARADHEHPLAARRRRWIEQPPPLERQVAQVPLDRVDRDSAVEVGTVADALARVVADAPVNSGKRVVGHQRAPRQLVLVRLHVRKPRLDVLPRRATRIAWRQQIDVHRALLADRTRARAPVQQIRQRRDVPSQNAHVDDHAEWQLGRRTGAEDALAITVSRVGSRCLCCKTRTTTDRSP